MIYVLMLQKDYFEVSKGLVSSSFRDRDPNDYFEKALRANHPNAYRRREEERKRQHQLYDKYRNYRPSRVLSGRELQEAIEICSEESAKCFSFQETLAELGLHNLYTSQDRFNSLTKAIDSGYAVLALTGNNNGWGGHYVTLDKPKSNTFDEAVTSFAADSAVSIGAAATGVYHGLLQFAKDGDVRESFEVMNRTQAQIKDKLKYKISDETQEAIDNNPIIKGAGYAVENTIGKAVNYAAENLPEDVVFYAGSALATGLELTPMGGKAKNLLRNGEQFASKGKLKPNISYVTGEFDYVYKTDKMGRIVEFKAEKLQLTQRSDRLPHNSATPGKLPGDHAGHLAGDRFGGSPELDNLVSQLSDVNLSSYKVIENEWARAIKQGKNVSVDIDIGYVGDNTRPSYFDINYKIDGRKLSNRILND